MKNLFICLGLLFTSSVYSQNVGINKISPTEKLDVAGNIKADTAKISSLLLSNGFIKVIGPDKTAFTVTAITGMGGNTSSYLLVLNYASMSSTDILFVTHNYVANYVGAVGTWWNGSNWFVFKEDLTPIPNGEKFNVLVIKQ